VANSFPRAILFDLDGTLIDSYPAITASVNHVRALHGLPALAEGQVKKLVGRGAVQLMAQAVGIAGTAANLQAYSEHHRKVMRAGTKLLPGVAETLTFLQARQIRLGVCSNKPVAFTRELLDFLGISNHFDVVLGPEDVAHAKPAPDMLLEAMKRLQVAPLEALYVGDMVVDIETAWAAGVRIWVVDTGSDDAATLDKAKPEYRLHDLLELTRRI
jgi:phosphoglycolate phosphatase